MKVLLNEERQTLVQFVFANGWTASLLKRHGRTVSLVAFREDTPGVDNLVIDEQDAFDDEVPAFLAKIAALPILEIK